MSLRTYIIILGLVIATAESLFPPWASIIAGASYPAVRRFVFSPPPVVIGTTYRVDELRLLNHLIIILAATWLVAWLVGLLVRHDRRTTWPP